MNRKNIKHVLAIAIPVIIENLFQVILGVTDTYFVSKVSAEAIGAVGITNLWMNVMIAFFVAVSVGTVALVSRANGKKDVKTIVLIEEQTLILSLLLGLFFGISFFFLKGHILSFFGASGQILALGRIYFSAVAVPVVFLSLHMGLSSMFKAMGKTKLTMKVGLVMVGINMSLDYVLIMGVGFIPPMGIWGAGLATTISRMIGTGLLFIYWRREVQQLIPKHQRFPKKIHKPIVYQLLTIGLPAGVEKLFMRFGQLVYGGLIMKIGSVAYIGHNIAGTIESISYLPAMGFGVAAATLIGQSLGEKEYKKATEYGWYAYGLGSLVMMGIATIFFFGGEFLAQHFTDDPAIIEKVGQVLKLIALFQPFLASTTIIASALQGAGETRIPMLLTGIGIWGIRIMGVYVLGLQMGWGLYGVWVAYVMDIILRGSILVYVFYRGKWQKIKLSRVFVD